MGSCNFFPDFWEVSMFNNQLNEFAHILIEYGYIHGDNDDSSDWSDTWVNGYKDDGRTTIKVNERGRTFVGYAGEAKAGIEHEEIPLGSAIEHLTTVPWFNGGDK